MDIQIDFGNYDDLPDILNLVKELAVYEKMPHAVSSSLRDYQNAFNENRIFILKATQDQEIIGMALYYYTFSTWKGRMMYLEDLYVKEKGRRHGVGKLLFDRLLQDCEEKDCVLLKWQVLDWNEPAIKFYEKIGATIEKEWWNGKMYLPKYKHLQV